MNSEENNEAPQINEPETTDDNQPLYMFQYFPDPTTGGSIPQMLPYFYTYFSSFMQMTDRLYETKNAKWSKQQEQSYVQCLTDMRNYIVSYIFTGVVEDFNVFNQTMYSYGEQTNPVGYQLYQLQLDYIIKKDEGYDFNQQNKKKKKQKKQELGQDDPSKKKQKQQKVKEEVEVIRKQDPIVTTEELLSKTFPLDRYTDMQSFKKQNANLIFIGHVDSGKSTLTGNIMKELKQVDEQQLTRNKQEAKQTNMQSWQLAFIADVDPNERKRGKTVQCSKMMFVLENRRYTLFDAPGHKNYVPNMIMGACQADIAILIISAKEGQFESGFEKQGQTKQHAMLATALGVRSMLAVVTKMATVQWSQERFKYIKEQVTPFLSSSCGFNNVEFIPIDSLTNTNIHSREQGGWYKGPALLELLNIIKLPHRDPDGPLRIPVVDKFRDVGQFFVYGKVQSGKIVFENQTVSLLPNRQYLVIKQIFNAKDQRLPYALAGENVKLRIKGIEDNQIHRGDVICNNLNYCQQSMQFKANLTVLELPEHKKLVSSGYECVIHMHAISEEAEILSVDGKVDNVTKKSIKATFLRSGEIGKVVIKLKSSICMQKYDFMPGLGRFTLRDEGKTIGFGEVLKIKPSKNLTKQQKDQLGVKTQQQGLTKDLTKKLEVKE